MKNELKQNLISLIDRRTIITTLAILLLFILAFKSIEARIAIDGIVFVCVTLIGANSAQRSLIAWAAYRKKSQGEKPKNAKPEEE